MKYDYQCIECKNIWEEEHSIKEDKDSLGLTCPSCSSDNIKRYLGFYSRATVIFKGTGWYAIDSALDKAGMPKNIQHSQDTKDAIRRSL